MEGCNSPAERIFTKSDAALRIADGLGGVWKAALLGKFLPLSLRNAAYDFIALNRYRVFGKRTECRLPAPADQHKFLQ